MVHLDVTNSMVRMVTMTANGVNGDDVELEQGRFLEDAQGSQTRRSCSRTPNTDPSGRDSGLGVKLDEVTTLNFKVHSRSRTAPTALVHFSTGQIDPK
jgi:hypothetical protein